MAALCAGLAACSTDGALAADRKIEPAPAGSIFDVRQLDIRLSRQASNAAQLPWQVQVSGAGQSSYSRSGKTWRLPYEAKDAVALLNALYAIRFFDLPHDYSSQDVAQLRADGSVVVLQKFTSNSNLNRVCVSIAAAEKCVGFGKQAPVELERIFERQFADAERLAVSSVEGK